jgi:hypothetical protein
MAKTNNDDEAPVRTTADEIAEMAPHAPTGTGTSTVPLLPTVRVDEDGTQREYFSGVELDPVDGRPIFANGMSRYRYLEVRRKETRAANLEELRAIADEEAQAASVDATASSSVKRRN